MIIIIIINNNNINCQKKRNTVPFWWLLRGKKEKGCRKGEGSRKHNSNVECRCYFIYNTYNSISIRSFATVALRQHYVVVKICIIFYNSNYGFLQQVLPINFPFKYNWFVQVSVCLSYPRTPLSEYARFVDMELYLLYLSRSHCQQWKKKFVISWWVFKVGYTY